jgi:hypothetical protein
LDATSIEATALLPGFDFAPAVPAAVATNITTAGTAAAATAAVNSTSCGAIAPSMLLQCSRAYTAPTTLAAAAAVPLCNSSSSSSSDALCTGTCAELDTVLPVQHSFIAADVAELLCAGSDTAAFGPSMVSELLIGNSSSNSSSSNEEQYRIRDSGRDDCFSGMQLHCSELAATTNGSTSAAASAKRKRDIVSSTAAAAAAAASSASSSSNASSGSSSTSARLATV